MRKLNSPENFALVPHIAHILLKQEQSEKIGIKAKRLRVPVTGITWSDWVRFEMRLPQ